MSLRLAPPSDALREAFLELAREYRDAGDDRYVAARHDFAGYLRRLERLSRQATCPTGFVAQDTYWLVDPRGRVLGSCRFRHRLAPHLEVEGGHVGYDVRPRHRRRGHATRMLALVREKAAARGMERLLVTCDFDNPASARVIEKNGGVETTSSVSPRSGKVVRRFWVPVDDEA